MFAAYLKQDCHDSIANSMLADVGLKRSTLTRESNVLNTTGRRLHQGVLITVNSPVACACNSEINVSISGTIVVLAKFVLSIAESGIFNVRHG